MLEGGYWSPYQDDTPCEIKKLKKPNIYLMVPVDYDVATHIFEIEPEPLGPKLRESGLYELGLFGTLFRSSRMSHYT